MKSTLDSPTLMQAIRVGHAFEEPPSAPEWLQTSDLQVTFK